MDEEEIEARLLKAESMLETLQVGQSLMAASLEAHGLMKDGEPTESSKKEKIDAAYRKVDVEKLIGQLKSEKKTSTKSKLPYFLAEQKNNKNNAFKVLQEKVRAHKGFWSKKQGGFLFKLWFNYGDESKLCWRKEGGKRNAT